MFVYWWIIRKLHLTMRLKQKILSIILPLILIPIAVLGIFAYRYSLNAQSTLEEVKLKADIKYRVNQVNLYTNHITSAVTYLATNKQFLDALLKGKSGSFAQDVEVELDKFAQIYTDTQQLSLTAPDGRILTTYQSSETNRNLMNKLPLTPHIEWQLITPNSVSAPLIGMQHPIFIDSLNNKKTILGYINIILAPDWEAKLKLKKSRGDKFMISDLTGNLLFSFPEGEMGTTIPRNAFRKLYDATQHDQSSTFKLGSNHVFFSGQLISGQYLFLYGQDKSFVGEINNELTWIALIIVLLTMLVAGLLVYHNIQKLVITPIKQLAQAKQKVAQGKFDIKLSTENKDEFGELFSAFNIMVKQLIVYREKERDGRLRLEYKVKERTEELVATNVALESSNIALEKAKQESEQASELKSAFVANISHEIRTPLTGIMGFTEQIIADSPNDRHQLDLLGRVLISGRHLLSLINNVLDVSKIEADKLDIEVTEFNIFELFNDVVSLLSTQAADKNLELVFNYIYPIPQYVRTDSTRLKQVLLNLASNAIKFTESGSVQIDVKYLAANSSIEVVVADTGIGMSEDVAQSLFQPFMQADVSISRRFGGTGLGLVISKNLAHLLGGDISVTSEIGKGSQSIFDFKINADNGELNIIQINSLLDLAKEQGQIFGFIDVQKNQDMVKTDVESQIPPETKGKVLVAEDVVDNQYLFKLLLDSLSLTYEIVSNGEQAIEKALTDEFDLILMDMQMPVMGGLEATSLLRQAGIDTPIYALTANVMKEDLQRHLAAGCNGTIAKPIDRDAFIILVRSVLNNIEEVDYPALPKEKLDELKRDYLLQLTEQSTLISRYLTNMDLLGLMSEFHKIKGSAGSYDLVVLSSLAGQIEHFCVENKDADSFWPELKNHVHTLLQTIRNLIHAESK